MKTTHVCTRKLTYFIHKNIFLINVNSKSRSEVIFKVTNVKAMHDLLYVPNSNEVFIGHILKDNVNFTILVGNILLFHMRCWKFFFFTYLN
jgi:hypothetical protein